MSVPMIAITTRSSTNVNAPRREGIAIHLPVAKAEHFAAGIVTSFTGTQGDCASSLGRGGPAGRARPDPLSTATYFKRRPTLKELPFANIHIDSIYLNWLESTSFVHDLSAKLT
jgi:hypothetical protein